MPYAPTTTDRSGEILAGGINNAMGQYAQELMRAQEIEQRRRTAAGQIQGLLASNPQIGQKADQALLAKVQSGKGNYNDTLQLLGTLNTVAKQEEEQLNAKLKNVQMEQFMARTQQIGAENQALKARLTEELRNRAAMGVPTGNAEIDANVPAVDEEGKGKAEIAIAKGMTDPQMIAQLRAMDEAKTRDERLRADPRAVNLGGMQGVIDASGNFHPMRQAAQRAPAAQPFEVGDRKLTKVGSTILDEKGDIVGKPKELDPMAAQMLYTRYQATIQQIQQAKEGTFESRETYQKRLRALQEQANFQAKQLGYAEPFPAGAAAAAAPSGPASSRYKIVEQK